VVEGAWCALDELCALVRSLAPEARIVAVKTDAVVVRNAERLDAAALGSAYREEVDAAEARVPTHELMVVDTPLDPLAGSLEWLEWPAWTLESVESVESLQSVESVESVEPFDSADPAGSRSGCLFLGMAGTGKSYEARAYLASMAAGGARVVAVGPTIKAAANVGGITVHALYEMRQPEHFADPPPTETLRAVARRYDAILVDEAFMCTGWMLETFLALRRAGVRFVLAGDPEQLPPVFTTAPPPAQVARSALVHELVDGRVRTLVDPRRSMGVPRAPGTMDLLLACRALLEAPPTREANARFAALFRVAASQDLPRRNLAYLNATCARVNRELVLRRARGRAWLVDGTVCVGAWALRRALRPESIVFATGAPVIARSAAYAARGKRLVVGALEPLESARPGTATIGAARVPLADVPLAFELAFCVTIHRAQCETIDEPYVVHDLDRILALAPRAARALLYVAVSRARSAALVSFSPRG
jgi:hypothetical protein